MEMSAPRHSKPGDFQVSQRSGMEQTKEIQRWGDRAMFPAEPIVAEEGPKVYLLWMTPDPLGAIAAACKMYKGEVVRSLFSITDEERIEYLEQVQRTKLQAPFEFVKFHFMIEGVTRAFTHQMVRQRTAVYAQESLRFAVKEDLPVALPPSLAGTTGVWRSIEEAILKEHPHWGDDSSLLSALWDGMNKESDAELKRWMWDQAIDGIERYYNELIQSGMPAEDARGLLPQNTLTRLHYCTDLRALLDHADNRLCTQAQFEWRLVFTRIVEAIRNAENSQSGPVDVVGSPGYVKMAGNLADMFRPVCYLTGKCEFMANFDRHCSIRSRVNANSEVGRPSRLWDGPDIDPDTGLPTIEAISPIEWLANPGAARS